MEGSNILPAEARDLARLGELKNTLQDRWFAVMKDIRDAATKGLWSLGTLIEMDIIVQLEEAGYRVKYMKGVSTEAQRMSRSVACRNGQGRKFYV
jgi:hypothetical protein